MDRIRAAFAGDANDFINRKIGLDRAHAFADAIGFVCFEPVQR